MNILQVLPEKRKLEKLAISGMGDVDKTLPIIRSILGSQEFEKVLQLQAGQSRRQHVIYSPGGGDLVRNFERWGGYIQFYGEGH